MRDRESVHVLCTGRKESCAGFGEGRAGGGHVVHQDHIRARHSLVGLEAADEVAHALFARAAPALGRRVFDFEKPLRSIQQGVRSVVLEDGFGQIFALVVSALGAARGGDGDGDEQGTRVGIEQSHIRHDGHDLVVHERGYVFQRQGIAAIFQFPDDGPDLLVLVGEERMDPLEAGYSRAIRKFFHSSGIEFADDGIIRSGREDEVEKPGKDVSDTFQHAISIPLSAVIVIY
jgi:hypothetical protein